MGDRRRRQSIGSQRRIFCRKPKRKRKGKGDGEIERRRRMDRTYVYSLVMKIYVTV